MVASWPGCQDLLIVSGLSSLRLASQQLFFAVAHYGENGGRRAPDAGAVEIVHDDRIQQPI
jgi:hypothetical protein